MPPRKTVQHDIDRKACAVLESALSTLSVNELASNDYGLDYRAEFFEDDDTISGTDFYIQCKGTKAPKFRNRRRHISYQLETDKLIYYVDRQRRPVFLFVIDVVNEMGWWCFTQGYEADFLRNKPWRNQKTVSIRLSAENQIDDLISLRRAVKEAARRIREEFDVSSIESAVRHRKQELEHKNPGARVSISVGESGLQYNIRPSTPTKLQLQIQGDHRGASRVLDDMFGRGIAVVPSDYGVQISLDTPFKGIGQDGPVSKVHISRPSRECSIRLCVDSGRESPAVVELAGQTAGGTKEIRLRGSAPTGILSIQLAVEVESPFAVETNIKFDISRWIGKPVNALPDFDRVGRLLALLASEHVRRAWLEVYVEGNKVMPDVDLIDQIDKIRPSVIAFDYVSRLRDIATWTGIGYRLGSHFMGEHGKIRYCHGILSGEALPVTPQQDVVCKVKMQRAEAECVKAPFACTIKICFDEYAFALLGHKLDLGPIQFAAKAKNVEILSVEKDDIDSEMSNVEIKVKPSEDWVAQRLPAKGKGA